MSNGETTLKGLRQKREQLAEELGLQTAEQPTPPETLGSILGRRAEAAGVPLPQLTEVDVDRAFTLGEILSARTRTAPFSEVVTPQQIPTILTSIGAGFKSGLLTPFELLGAPDVPEEGVTEEHPIARLFGEFAGIGVAWIPFAIGGRVTLLGVGLTVPKLGAYLSTRPTVTRILANSIGFAAFEAGAGPEERIGVRAARGLAIGLATEAFFLRKALQNRTANAPTTEIFEGIEFGRVPVVFDPKSGDRLKLSPFALQMERIIDPEAFVDDPQTMMRALLELGGPEEQIEASVAKIIENWTGVVAIEAVPTGEIGRVARAFKRALREENRVQIILHPTSLTRQNMVVNIVQPRPRPLANAIRSFGEDAFEFPRKLGRTGPILGADIPAIVLDDKAAEMILSANTDEVLGFTIEAGFSSRDLDIISRVEQATRTVQATGGAIVRGVRKIFDPSRIPAADAVGVTFIDDPIYDELLSRFVPRAAAAVAEDVPTLRRISSLIHEAGHVLINRKFIETLIEDLDAGRAILRETIDPAGVREVIVRNNEIVDISAITFQDIFRITDEAIARRTGAGFAELTPVTIAGKPTGEFLTVDIKLENLIDEFVQLAIADEANRVGATVAEVSSWLAREATPDFRDYFLEPQELFVRGLSLLFMNPRLALETSPLASRMILRLVRHESPQLRALLTRGPGVNAIEWIQKNLEEIPDLVQEIRILAKESPFEITAEMAEEYTKTNFFRGLEVVDRSGKPFVFLQRRGDQVVLQEFNTARTVLKAFDEVRPKTFADVIQRQRQVETKLQTLLNLPPPWVGLTLRDASVNAVRRAVINLEDYVVVRGGREGLVEWVTENAVTRDIVNILSSDETIAAFVVRGGKKGLVLEDEGLYKLYVADRSSVRMARPVVSGLFGPIDGNIDDLVLSPTFDSVALSLLREAGAAENELPYWLARMQDIKGRDLLDLVDADIRDGLNNALRETDGYFSRLFDDVALDIEAQSHNLKVNPLADGTFQIVNPETNVELARFHSMATARKFIESAGYPQFQGFTGDIVGGQINTNMFKIGLGGLGRSPAQSSVLAAPVAEETVKPGFIQNVLDVAAIMLPWTTPMENFSKVLERRGFGPAFTKIFEPAQRAVLRVARELDFIPREWLGERTIGQELRVIQDLAGKVGRKRYGVVRSWLENMTREEIAAGGFLGRPMTQTELRVSALLAAVGLDKEVPRLTATFQMAQSAVRNKEDFLRRLPQLRRRSNDPVWQETINRIEQASKEVADDFEELLTRIGMSKEERAAIREIEIAISGPKEEFNLFTVSRWGDARSIGEGFASGRAQFAAENAMTANEIALGEQLELLMGEAAMNWANIGGRRLFGGFWPHMRRWTDHGFLPDQPLMKKILPDEFVKYAGLRMRSGELDIYEVDPVLMAYKHVRSLLMGQFFDPVRPGLEAALAELKRGGFRRGYQIMNEYVDELIGKPITSFTALNEAVRTIARMFGVKEPDRIAEQLINNTVALGYGATIPFRAALLARNYFQMFQMVPARIGFEDFFIGLKRALSDDGFKMAVANDAIPIGVTPVFASTEVLGLEAFRGVNIRVRRAFERGFEWYRKADDVGRSAAFHGYRSRAKRLQEAVNNGKITWEQFRARAKVNTFDSVDIAEFERIWGTGNQEGAINYLGTILSRETAFRYGHANHPAGWGGIFGRLFGQFGTWPVQYKDYLLQGIARGGTKDKVEFLATHAAVNMGFVAAGAAAGINLWSFSSFPSLNYTGGPFADLSVDLIRMWNGSPAERALAKRSFFMQFPTFEDPRSIFIPGSYFVGDVWTVFREGDVDPQAFLEAGGFRFFEPDEKSGFEWLWGF